MRSLRVLLALLLCCPLIASAAERPTLAATRAMGVLRIDGALDDSAWAAAPAVTAFVVTGAREGQAPGESTLVKVLYDDTRVVFGIWLGQISWCRDSTQPESWFRGRIGPVRAWCLHMTFRIVW